MKRSFLTVVAVLMTVLCASAQMKIESPHADLDVNITRCAYAGGKVIIDMTLTNYGPDMEFNTRGSGVSAFDDEGNSYTFRNSTILVGIVSQGLSSSATYTLPQDVPQKFRMQLDKIDPNASKLALLKFAPHYSSYDKNPMGINKTSQISIRNLEWAK